MATALSGVSAVPTGSAGAGGILLAPPTEAEQVKRVVDRLRELAIIDFL